MAESGVYDHGDCGIKGDADRHHRYVELSLQGKWLAVANTWLRDNCPCSLETYYKCVPPLMPTHIKMFRKNNDPQLSMAKSALSRAIKGYPSDCQDPIVKVVDGVIEYLRVPKTMTIYDYSWVPCNPKCGDEVEFETLGKTRSQIEAAKVFLRRKGFRCIRKGVYRYGPEDLTERADAVN